MSDVATMDPLGGATLQHLRALIIEVADAEVTTRDVVGLMERVANSALAVQAMAMAAVLEEAERATSPVGPSGDLLPDPAFVPDEMALTLHCSSVTAHRRCQVAKDAVRHPALLTHWAAGAVSPIAVAVITEVIGSMNPACPRTHELVADAVEYATSHTPAQVRAWLTRRVMAADPDAAEDRRRRAVADRRVVFTPGVDSMASLWALLPAVHARQVFDTVIAVAQVAGSDDVRTMDQRRADALVDLVTGRAAPPQVQVQVVVSEEALAGSFALPEVKGVGPVLPDDLAELLQSAEGDVTCRLLRTDVDTGHLVAVGERQYRPSAPLRRAVEARDVVCRFPGCRRSASGPGMDLDHTVPWPQGPTDAGNLAALCRRHHRLKHSPGWQVRLDPDGHMQWITPGGRRFSTTPWCYGDPRAP